MHKILSIEDLDNSKDKTLYFKFEDKIDEIDCVTPICADLCAKSLGDLIEIKGRIEGIVRLECDLCLEKFNFKLNFQIEELFSRHTLVDNYGNSNAEFEIKGDSFITDLNGAKEIDIYDLLYQSVILNYPNKKVCGINCKGKQYLLQDDNYDPRLDVFKDIKINPKE